MTEQLHVELWISLASLLRSYTAVHGLDRGNEATIELDDREIVVRQSGKYLHLRRKGALVLWSRENGEGGRLHLTEAGRLRSSTEEHELDMAAEAWARELMQESKLELPRECKQ